MPEPVAPQRLDGCPSCLLRDVAPYRVEGTLHRYRCTGCLYSWTTAWGNPWAGTQGGDA